MDGDLINPLLAPFEQVEEDPGEGYEEEDYDDYYEEEDEDQISVDHEPDVVATVTGGYEYELVEPALASQECPVCKLPMRDAVQTRDCGHRFCRSCLEQALRTAERYVCPTCRACVDEVEGYYADLAFSRDILALLVKCVQNENGCDWTGELRHIEGHKEECLYEKIECADCGEFHERKDMVNHQLVECQQRLERCTFCNEKFRFIMLQSHVDEDCTRYPMFCANECEHEPIPREEMQNHLENDCPMTIVKCSYQNVGCQYEGRRCSISHHVGDSMEQHLKLTTTELSRTRTEQQQMRNEVDEIKKSCNVMAKYLKQLKEKNDSLEKRFGAVNEGYPRHLAKYRKRDSAGSSRPSSSGTDQ